VTCSDCVGAGSLVVPCVSPKGKGKGKRAPAHAMKAYRVGGADIDIAPLKVKATP